MSQSQAVRDRIVDADGEVAKRNAARSEAAVVSGLQCDGSAIRIELQRHVRADRRRRSIRSNDERRDGAARLHLNSDVRGLTGADGPGGRSIEEELARLRAQRCRERTGEHLRQREATVRLRLHREAVRERTAADDGDIAGDGELHPEAGGGVGDVADHGAGGEIDGESGQCKQGDGGEGRPGTNHKGSQKCRF